MRSSPREMRARFENSDRTAEESRPGGPAKARPRTHEAPAHLHGPARPHSALRGLS
ncbi:MAG TPA: hypothetical protein VFJ06_03725 [Halococcus sp.]|nr:hypothetical protein [Halococcus sp.]